MDRLILADIIGECRIRPADGVQAGIEDVLDGCRISTAKRLHPAAVKACLAVVRCRLGRSGCINVPFAVGLARLGLQPSHAVSSILLEQLAMRPYCQQTLCAALAVVPAFRLFNWVFGLNRVWEMCMAESAQVARIAACGGARACLRVLSRGSVSDASHIVLNMLASLARRLVQSQTDRSAHLLPKKPASGPLGKLWAGQAMSTSAGGKQVTTRSDAATVRREANWVQSVVHVLGEEAPAGAGSAGHVLRAAGHPRASVPSPKLPVDGSTASSGTDAASACFKKIGIYDLSAPVAWQMGSEGNESGDSSAAASRGNHSATSSSSVAAPLSSSSSATAPILLGTTASGKLVQTRSLSFRNAIEAIEQLSQSLGVPWSGMWLWRQAGSAVDLDRDPAPGVAHRPLRTRDDLTHKAPARHAMIAGGEMDGDARSMASSKAASVEQEDFEKGITGGSACPAWLAALGPKLTPDQVTTGQDRTSLASTDTAISPGQTAGAYPFSSAPDPATWLCALVRLLVCAPSINHQAALAATVPMGDSAPDQSTVWDRAGQAMDLLEDLRDTVASDPSGGLAQISQAGVSEVIKGAIRAAAAHLSDALPVPQDRRSYRPSAVSAASVDYEMEPPLDAHASNATGRVTKQLGQVAMDAEDVVDLASDSDSDSDSDQEESSLQRDSTGGIRRASSSADSETRVLKSIPLGSDEIVAQRIGLLLASVTK